MLLAYSWFEVASAFNNRCVFSLFFVLWGMSDSPSPCKIRAISSSISFVFPSFCVIFVFYGSASSRSGESGLNDGSIDNRWKLKESQKNCLLPRQSKESKFSTSRTRIKWSKKWQRTTERKDSSVICCQGNSQRALSTPRSRSKRSENRQKDNTLFIWCVSSTLRSATRISFR